jgi:hypothetical protein
MVGKKHLLVLLFIMGGVLSVKAQSFTYSYINPCNGRTQSVQLSTQSSEVTMFFAGQYRIFTYAELSAGAYEQWVQSIRDALPPGANPCASEGVVESNNITNFIGSVTANGVANISSVVSMASSIGSSVGSVPTPPPAPRNGGSGANNDNNSSSSEGGGEITVVDDKNQQTASGGESENNGEGGGGGKGGKSSSKISNGALIATGDIVIIRNDSNITKKGNDNFRFNTSLTHINTSQTFIKGININYQTGQNILNLSGYGSLKVKGYMGIFSTSYMTNFKDNWFLTASLLNAQKIDKVTLMGGTTFTLGEIDKNTFRNWSLIGGGFTNFKGGKSIGVNFLGLAVYSPYIYFYAGQWYKSGLLIIPMVNTDLKVTDKFKWTVSFSGVYQLNQTFLNWQVLTGTKLML